MQENKDTLTNESSNYLKIIAKNLNYLMSSKGIGAQNLSNKTGIGIATINNLKRGGGNPTITTLCAIAEFFHVNIGTLTDADLSQTVAYLDNVKPLPLIKYNEIEAYIRKTSFTTKSYTTEVDSPGDDSLFAIEITNNALLPELERGTLCIVSMKENFCDGDIVLVKIKEYFPCFRRIFVGNMGFQFSNIALEADNSCIVEYDNYTVIGVLLKKINRMK